MTTALATAMASAERVDIREELRQLGERRNQHEGDGTDLAADISDALMRAQGVVSRAEAARLIGIHRTTLYRVYLPHG